MTGTARATFAAPPTTPAAPTRPQPATPARPVASPPAAVAGTLPGTSAVPAGHPVVRRPIRPAGPPLASRLWQLLRGGYARASQLTAQDKRVIGYLLAAVLVASGATVDLDAPSAITAPDQLPTRPLITGHVPAAAPAGDGKVDDPTSKGRITVATAHGLAEIRSEMGPALRSVGCWDPHEWNPKSDHPKGKGCDLFPGRGGVRAQGDDLTNGNRLVGWLRQHAGPLQVAYVIWQCRIWSPERGDRLYNGGGVYSCDDPTGGHWDHIHVSFRR